MRISWRFCRARSSGIAGSRNDSTMAIDAVNRTIFSGVIASANRKVSPEYGVQCQAGAKGAKTEKSLPRHIHVSMFAQGGKGLPGLGQANLRYKTTT